MDALPKAISYLLICGSKDVHVNPNNSRLLAKKMKEYSLDYRLEEYDTDHIFRGKRVELDDLLVEWFNEKLC